MPGLGRPRLPIRLVLLQCPSGCARTGQAPFANTVSAFSMPFRMCFGLGRPRLPLSAFTQHVMLYIVHVHLQRRQCPEMTIVVDWDAKPHIIYIGLK